MLSEYITPEKTTKKLQNDKNKVFFQKNPKESVNLSK